MSSKASGRQKTIYWNAILRRGIASECIHLMNPFPYVERYAYKPRKVRRAKPNLVFSMQEVELREENQRLRKYIEKVDELDLQMGVVSPMW